MSYLYDLGALAKNNYRIKPKGEWMRSLLSALERHYGLTIVLIFFYFSATVLLHEQVTMISDFLLEQLSIGVYNNVVTTILVGILVSLFAVLILNILKGGDKSFKIFHLIFPAALMPLLM